MTITATHVEAEITTEIKLGRRSVKHTALIEQRDGYSVCLSLNVQHDNAGRYLITVWRESHARGFISVSIHEDRARGEYHSVGARYSAKNLQALAAEQLEVFKRDIEELGEWARSMPKR